MGYIEPLSLPSAAGVNFGEGDVRHFSEGDGVNVPGLSNPTRQLAARDSLIAEKLNLAIAEVNNKEQIIPLPIYRMVMPPSTEEIVANHRIPSGYEARVLNAAVSSSPNSADIELNVLWSAGFGNVSGSSVMTTTAESSGGTTFSPAGEFVIQVKNKGGVSLDVVASVMITMRPITDVAGALLPAATVAPPGPVGPKGESGGKGDTGGVGPAGSPGLNFRGQWERLPFPVTYQTNDVVVHDFAGTSSRSSFVCLQGHIADGINMPQPELMPSPFWNFIAEAGQSGSSGTAASVATSSSNVALSGVVFTGGSFVGGSAVGDYGGGGSSNSQVAYDARESTVQVGPNAMKSIVGTFKHVFTGSIGVRLPGTSDGASRNWEVTDVAFTADGTNALFYVNSSNEFAVEVSDANPVPVSASFSGYYAT